MQSKLPFPELFARVRRGDAQAAEALVREYEPEIRRAIRFRLTDPKLRRVVDTVDICQSVLGNFFARAALGQFDVDRPEQLVALLVTMARNRVTNWHHHQRVRQADKQQPLAAGEEPGAMPSSGAPTPSRVVAGRELLQEFRKRLSSQELVLADARAAGREWKEIAGELNESPEALRKRLSRACDRVARELRLEE
jgi:RNA polymerase sigma factor (sigma-70 family)